MEENAGINDLKGAAAQVLMELLRGGKVSPGDLIRILTMPEEELGGQRPVNYVIQVQDD